MKWLGWILAILTAGIARAEMRPLTIDTKAWNADPIVWNFRNDGAGSSVHCRLLNAHGAAVYETAPLSSQVTVEGVFTPKAADSHGWNLAAVAIVENERNFWHLALVQTPPDQGCKPYIELTEMRDGVWLSQSNLRLETDENTGVLWKFDASYRLRLSMDSQGITGIITTVDGKPILKRRFAFNAAAVTRGRPALRINGMTCVFSNLQADWGEAITEPIVEPTFPAFTMEPIATGITDKATGFFHVTQKPDGRWWPIDPLGRGTVLLGVDHVTFQGHWCEKLGYHPHGKNNEKKFADHAAWEAETLERLKAWGFTMLGAGCDPILNHRGLVHTLFIDIGSHLASLGDEYDLTPNESRPCSAFPNVFHPDFEAFCRYRARQTCTPNRNDPWLFGYFIDNELAWWGRGPLATGLFDSVMKKGSEHSGKAALRDFLAKDAENDVAKFNQRWDTQIKSFDELLTMNSLPSTTESQQDVKHAFLRFVADRYFSITSRAIREADPNHLVLGARFAGTGGADPVVWEVSGKYCDVVTFNCYPMANLDTECVYTELGKKGELVADHFQKYYDYVKRPMLITEWSFPALDAGLPSIHGAGQRFRTQAERTKATRLFARTMLSLPFLLGYDYFMWVDEPALGISTPFPEDSNYGLIDETGKPYQLLTEMFTSLHREAGKLRFEPQLQPQKSAKANVIPDAMATARKAASPNAKAFFTREGDAFHAGNGRIELSGRLGNGNMVQNVTLDGEKETFGQYNAMIQTLKNGHNFWTNAQTVQSVDGRMVDGIAVIEITSEGVIDRDHFEVTHRLILPPGSPWFIAELVRVKNTGETPFQLEGLFFRLYNDFKVAPQEHRPPNVWGMPLADCWLDENDGRFFGVVASKASGLRIKFYYNETAHSQHPDARLELSSITLSPGSEFTPKDPTFVLCTAGHGGNEGWAKTSDELDAAIQSVEAK
jgi:hypothetical protein